MRRIAKIFIKILAWIILFLIIADWFIAILFNFDDKEDQNYDDEDDDFDDYEFFNYDID